MKTPLEIIEDLVASGTTNIKKIGEEEPTELLPGQVVLWEGKLSGIVIAEKGKLDEFAADVAASWRRDFQNAGESK